ncbi:MAG TPA: FAD-dependent oxidoreductase [Pseudorhizobium sp.]|jgi:3-(3-hydroxy-phenyl)propionate hydroxylase|nr:FAD-dependent oxidoreductase [Pseudorhizobium sp.]
MANVTGIPVYKEIGATPAPVTAHDQARVVIVGAGPVGLALALDLGRRGQPVTVLNRLDFVAHCSKAICFSKRSLDILDRLGAGDAAVEKGVTWNVGKVFWGASENPIYQFDTLPVKDQKRPGFINIQQYYIEEYLLDGCQALPNIDIRWGHAVDAVTAWNDGAELTVTAVDGSYKLRADWVVACDGARSTVRDKLGLDFEGRVFEDNFLIADIRMKHEMPAERWFWFDPPFNPGRSALMHKQPDDVWRLDFQLGWNIDREAATRPENVEPFIRAMLGENLEFEREWYSVYSFQCRRMARFVHGHVIFAGDAAHLVSPFGARGCNGGLADADNLGWKLDLVLNGEADESLIETYNLEAVATADENILNSTRSTDFLTPKSKASQALRDAVLELAKEHAFARPFVNSGRLSTAVSYADSPLSTPDEDAWEGGVAPGMPVLDAPLAGGWLLDELGNHFVLLACGGEQPVPPSVRLVALEPDSLAAKRLGLMPGASVLVRPDQYVAARWQQPNFAAVGTALRRAKGETLCLQ